MKHRKGVPSSNSKFKAALKDVLAALSSSPAVEGLLRAQCRGGGRLWAVSHHCGVHLGGAVSQPHYSPSPFLRVRILPEVPFGSDFSWAKYLGAVSSMPLEARSRAAVGASGELGSV